ncbi:hypothetical protein V8F20_012345 [Naviculisporaceae sp. PSN 640]
MSVANLDEAAVLGVRGSWDLDHWIDEFGQWKPACNRFDEIYLEAYHQRVNRSAPEEDYDGRLDLYKLRFNAHVSALFFDNPTLREQVLDDIRDLVERYGGADTDNV